MSDLNVDNLIKGLTESQTVMNYAFAGFKTETEQRFNEMNNRLNEHDKIFEKEIHITSSMAKTLQEMVKEKVKTICKENELDYKTKRNKVFPRIWHNIKSRFNVPSYRDLPKIFWEDVVQYVKDMTVNVQDIAEEEL